MQNILCTTGELYFYIFTSVIMYKQFGLLSLFIVMYFILMFLTLFVKKTKTLLT